MKCTTCGNEVADNLFNCPYCGTPMVSQQIPQQYNQGFAPQGQSTYQYQQPTQVVQPQYQTQPYTQPQQPSTQNYQQNTIPQPTPQNQPSPVNYQNNQSVPQQNTYTPQPATQQYNQSQVATPQNSQYQQYAPNQQTQYQPYASNQPYQQCQSNPQVQNQQYSPQGQKQSTPALVAFAHVPATFWLGFIDNTPRGKKAASQGLWLLICGVGGGIIFAILTVLLAFIKLGWIGSILSWGPPIAILVFSIMGIVKGFQGEDYEIPLLGHIQLFK